MNRVNFGVRVTAGVRYSRHVVEELGEGLHRVVPNVVELVDHLFRRFFGDGGGGNGWLLIREKVGVVGARDLEFEI